MRYPRTARHPRMILAVVGIAVGFAVVGFGLAGGAGNAPPPTTIPSPGASAALVPPPGTPTSQPVQPPSETLAPQGPPVIDVPATSACTSGEVNATLQGAGPYDNDPATAQQIISLSSTVPCYVSGYSELAFSTESGAVVSTTVSDGSYTGASQSVSNVSLSTLNEGSFLFQYVETQNGATSNCPLETALSIEIPDQSLTINVNMNGVGLLICGTVNVSPIIQGNSIDRYVS